MKKLGRYLNRFICTISGIGVVVFGAMLDSTSYIPYVLCMACVILVCLYALANGWFE